MPAHLRKFSQYDQLNLYIKLQSQALSSSRKILKINLLVSVVKFFKISETFLKKNFKIKKKLPAHLRSALMRVLRTFIRILALTVFQTQLVKISLFFGKKNIVKIPLLD